jgi:hypothetical protein
LKKQADQVPREEEKIDVYQGPQYDDDEGYSFAEASVTVEIAGDLEEMVSSMMLNPVFILNGGDWDQVFCAASTTGYTYS